MYTHTHIHMYKMCVYMHLLFQQNEFPLEPTHLLHIQKVRTHIHVYTYKYIEKYRLRFLLNTIPHTFAILNLHIYINPNSVHADSCSTYNIHIKGGIRNFLHIHLHLIWTLYMQLGVIPIPANYWRPLNLLVTAFCSETHRCIGAFFALAFWYKIPEKKKIKPGSKKD
jgi:hypothetical protein